MKSKYWVIILAAVLAVCIFLSVRLLGDTEQARWAQIWSNGVLQETVSLYEDRVLTVESSFGTNIITVRNGSIAVTQADCPDHYCMERGFCSGGAQIVCLPNRLVIRLVGEQRIDGVSG